MSLIERKSELILTKAVMLKASDVHIIPRKTFSQIQLRLDNDLLDMDQISTTEAEKLISHFKFRAKMDIGERRRPQNGALAIFKDNVRINLRISTLPTVPHESLSIRLLPQNEIIPIQNLSLFKTDASKLKFMMRKPHGLLLISGPTGSGKTTTIYSLLSEVSNEKRVITIEDPVEKKLDNFIQVEINEKADLSYTEALKATLRHDPDIIMIGEIRDAQTAKIAVRAAMTGHLVISTIHAKNCLSSLSRLQEFGVHDQDIQETVIGLVSQRLVELICPYCEHSCSKSCKTNRQIRRLAVFEVVTGEQLSQKIKFQTLEDKLRKSVALGYIDAVELERWLC